jgi:hypothetical protein
LGQWRSRAEKVGNDFDELEGMMIEWLNAEIEPTLVTAWVIGSIFGMCLWAAIQALADTWTIKTKPRKRIDNQLRTSSSTEGVQCFGCRFEESGGLECWMCVHRPGLMDNFEEAEEQ